ncbi:cellulase family glycosylhydrolase [Ruficoccus sp. ZRK36]|uniref:cellulase family glycosylhydrolase n=1 Tax=Ruficoccus sp. ZRK36 TaxID=2866311 RepID=UPI001C73A4E7|nr:cellulase family glycosylhydrolase [Ruficoccus sp. ZRK36]QYY37278.1 glycoside hydrolase family 5 protein [Ruficoccus sp. ZRK36]
MCSWTVEVSPQWRKVVREFTVEIDAPSPLAMLRLALGNIPAGETLWLGPVTLERVDLFSSLLGDDWLYAPEAAGEALPLDSIPAQATPVTQGEDGIDLGALAGEFGEGLTAVLYQEFVAPADGVMTVGMGADWYFEAFCNGQSVYSTMERGNLASDIAPTNHVFNVPVQAGINLLAVRVSSGSEGWSFVSGTVPVVFGDVALERLFRPVAGKDYRPVDDTRFLEVQPGTALDLSGLDGLPRPAGSLGRVIIGATGKPVFEQRPDMPVRFYAFSMPLNGKGMWRQYYHEWDKATIDRYADAVERRGYNLVRLHLPETFLTGWQTMLDSRNRPLDEVMIPQNVAELEQNLDAGNYDRMDYLIAAFKARGIYVTIDLAARNMITRSADNPHEKSFKTRLFTDPAYRNHWKVFVDYFMGRVNPYTGTAYKDETSIAFVSFINEQDFRIATGMEFLTPSFREYLRTKYGSDAALATAWGQDITFDTVPDITESDMRTGDQRAEDTGEFLIATMAEMTTWFYNHLRATGYRGLVTHWDMIMRMLEIPGRAMMPAIAQHTYFAHPGSLPPGQVIPKSVRPNSFAGNYPNDTVIEQTSSLDSSYVRAAAAARFFDRPYFNTEYSHSGPNRYRNERGLYFSSYAALQDWDAITVHNTTVQLHPDPFLTFDSGMDPISRINEFLAAVIFLRGDVSTAPSSVGLQLEDYEMFPDHYLAAIGDEYAKLALVTRIGVLYSEVAPLEPVGSFTPTMSFLIQDFTDLNVSQWYVKADTDDSGRSEPLFQALRQNGILDPANQTDPSSSFYESETGELRLDGAAETMQVITPRLEGALVKDDTPVTLDRLTIQRATRPAAIAVVAIDGQKDLGQANRLLLILSTNAFNTGDIFETDELHICYEVGNTPALIETMHATLSLDDERDDLPEVYALNFDGTRAEPIAVTRVEGELKLDLDTSQLTYGAGFFEIVYP